MGYLEILLSHSSARHFGQSVGQHVKIVRSQMYFGEHMPIVENLGQYIWKVDPRGQCGLFRLLSDAHGVTGPKPPRIADVCPSALPQDCAEVSIAHRLQKHPNSITEHCKYIVLEM